MCKGLPTEERGGDGRESAWLDNACAGHRARPAGGRMRVELVRDGTIVATAMLNEDGRTGSPLLTEATFALGRWELRFYVGAYFRALGLGEDPPFHDVASVAVILRADRGHYHAPCSSRPCRHDLQAILMASWRGAFCRSPTGPAGPRGAWRTFPHAVRWRPDRRRAALWRQLRPMRRGRSTPMRGRNTR